MWIEVRGGPGALWVQSDECRLPNGELAFVNETWPAPPLPDWFGAPADSALRESSDMRGMGWPLIEHRSMKANAGQVLTFYKASAERGGLARTEKWPAGRAGPGYSAENGEYAFNLDVYEHRDLAFWTIQLSYKNRKRHQFASPPLLFVGRDDERVTLRHERIGQEYWAPVATARDSEPPTAEREMLREEPLTWSLLPTWVQFGIDNGTEGNAVRNRGQNGAEEWSASIHQRFEGDPQVMFEACLNSLDAHGFDAGGTERPDHTYFISILQGGHSQNAHIRSKEGDRAIVTALNTLGHLMLFIRYSPAQGQSYPASNS
jgi:hypothetical protein